MHVASSLADIEFGIGEISRKGENLIIKSNASSTIETVVTLSPTDALSSLGVLALSSSVWIFLLKLPFALLFNVRRAPSNAEAWQARRRATGLNKPW